MTTTIHLPMILREYAEGAKSVSIPSNNDTITEVLNTLEGKYPGVCSRLLDERGSLRRFVNIYINDDDIRMFQGMETRIPASAEISIIPAVAGG